MDAINALRNWHSAIAGFGELVQTNLHLREMIPVAGDCCCHRQFAAIGGKPEVLKAPPEGLKPLLVWLIHLRDVKTSAEHFVSRGEHNSLEYCNFRVLS